MTRRFYTAVLRNKSNRPRGHRLIFVFGYFEFFAAIIFVLGRKTKAAKVRATAFIWAVPIVMNVVARVFLDWRY